MKRTWIKLYVEILDDPKMGLLPDYLWRRVIELFMLAGEMGKDGVLGPVSGMAWRLRVNEDDLVKTLRTLSQIGIVHDSPDGWVVSHFKDRQYSDSFERTRRYRERHSDAVGDGSGDAVVAEKDSPSTSPSNSSSGSSLSEGEGTGEGAVFSAYESDIGLLTPKIADGLKADIDDYSPAWVIAAIDYAVRQEKRSLAYVEGVLKGWKRDGLNKPPSKNGSKPEAPADSDEVLRRVAQNAFGSR